MSGESDEHALLVARLTDFVKKEHGRGGNLAVYLDDRMRGPGASAADWQLSARPLRRRRTSYLRRNR